MSQRFDDKGHQLQKHSSTSITLCCNPNSVLSMTWKVKALASVEWTTIISKQFRHYFESTSCSPGQYLCLWKCATHSLAGKPLSHNHRAQPLRPKTKVIKSSGESQHSQQRLIGYSPYWAVTWQSGHGKFGQHIWGGGWLRCWCMADSKLSKCF